MKRHYTYRLILAAFIVMLQSCLMENPESRMQKLSDSYKNKEISNSQMLFSMGKVFRQNPDNNAVRLEYFQKMIISGHASYILHYYMNRPGDTLGEKDMKTILFAMQKGNHYNMAEKFTPRFSDKFRAQLNEMADVNDSLRFYNNLVKNHQNAEAFEKRGRFFTRLNATDVANLDLDKSIRLSPCNPGALYEKALLLINNEKSGELAELLEQCSSVFKGNPPQWYPVFLNLVTELKALKSLSLDYKELLFRQANLYVNNGFLELALRKTNKLLKADGNNNPDYLALQGYIYFKMNNKEMAKQYVSEAERISGRKSKLSELIAQME